jgi:hypothetical protein
MFIRTRLEETRGYVGDHSRRKSSRSPQVRLTRERVAIDKNVDGKSKVSVEGIPIGDDALESQRQNTIISTAPRMGAH